MRRGRRGDLVNVVGSQIQRPGRRCSLRQRTDSGGCGALGLGDRVSAELDVGRPVAPAENLGVETLRRLYVRDAEVRPARHSFGPA